MNPPTKEEIDRIIATLQTGMKTWKGNPGYARTLEVELFCVMAYRDRVFPS